MVSPKPPDAIIFADFPTKARADQSLRTEIRQPDEAPTTPTKIATKAGKRERMSNPRHVPCRHYPGIGGLEQYLRALVSRSRLYSRRGSLATLSRSSHQVSNW